MFIARKGLRSRAGLAESQPSATWDSGSGSGPAPMSDLIIADLNRRKLDLVCEIERLRRQYCVTSLHWNCQMEMLVDTL